MRATYDVIEAKACFLRVFSYDTYYHYYFVFFLVMGEMMAFYMCPMQIRCNVMRDCWKMREMVCLTDLLTDLMTG